MNDEHDDDGSGMRTVPLVIALFHGLEDESPMRVDTERTLTWDEERGEVVLALPFAERLDWWRDNLMEAIQRAYLTPSGFGETIPEPNGWQPPGWSAPRGGEDDAGEEDEVDQESPRV